jgi:hypothetical protein
MRIDLLQLSTVLATTLVALAGCGSKPDKPLQQARNGPAGYRCQDEAVVVTAAAVDRELLYVCDDDNKKITWKFDTTKVNGVSIEFKPDYPFNGPPKTIVSKPGDDHVDSPSIPKKSQLVLYKYFITITSTSGQTTLPDPHVLSGGSY